MDFNQKLYNELNAMRNQLKYEGSFREGRTPVVCSDESLYEIARLQPKTPEEFLCVPGIGQSFVEKYAERFMPVIKKHMSAIAP